MSGQNSKPGDHMLDEDDIGSGERTPGQEDTDKIIEQIGQDAGKKQSRSRDENDERRMKKNTQRQQDM